MPGTTTRTTRVIRVLPIAAALLALAACSNSTGAGSSPSATTGHKTTAAGNAAYLASCKAEDTAYQAARPYLNDSASARRTYASLDTYTDQIDAAATDEILNSDVWKALMAEYTDAGLLSVDQDESQSTVEQDLGNFEADRKELVAACASHGYVYADKTG